MSVEKIISLNVGGLKVASSLTTLNQIPFFSSLLSPLYSPMKDEDGNIFIDRDGQMFLDILNIVRSRWVIELLFFITCIFCLKILEDKWGWRLLHSLEGGDDLLRVGGWIYPRMWRMERKMGKWEKEGEGRGRAACYINYPTNYPPLPKQQKYESTDRNKQ